MSLRSSFFIVLIIRSAMAFSLGFPYVYLTCFQMLGVCGTDILDTLVGMVDQTGQVFSTVMVDGHFQSFLGILGI